MSSSKETNPQPADSMVECKICHVYFNVKRITSHERTCGKKVATTKPIMNKQPNITSIVKTTDTRVSKKLTTDKKGHLMTTFNASSKPPMIKGSKKGYDWRKTHEEFIQGIRAAREIKAYVASGGKLSDLPQPPPSENPDYIQCPHCSRRFNEAAAERHIPKCKDMIHNKPRPDIKNKKVAATKR